ncbi:MAG: hypothetical protein GC161_12005 [Planctomycetaceae bacterium]|nr:hypothetical protein [Planctomycetaceae bacterium]
MLVSLALALVLPLAPFGDVLIVDDDGGPGIDHTDLGSAIAAAQPGDTILTLSGTYAAYDTTPGQLWFEIKRGITVVAQEGDDVKLVTPVHVIGPASGETVHLRGLTIDTTGWSSPEGLRSLVHVGLVGDARRLVVEDCVLRPATLSLASVPSSGWGTDAILLYGSECVLRNVSVVAGASTVFHPLAPGGAGEEMPLRAVNSIVHVYDSEILSAPVGSTAGEPAVQLQGSQLFVSGSRIEGANGNPGFSFLCGSNGLPAVRVVPGGMIAASVTALDSELIGGQPGSSTPGCLGGPPVVGPAVDLQAGTFVQLDGSARVLAGSRTVTETTQGALQLAGQPGDLVVLGVATGPISPLALPFLTGALHLAPASPLFAIGVVGGSGTLNWSFFVPPLGSGGEASAVTVQAFALDTAGGVTASGPLRVTLLSAWL